MLEGYCVKCKDKKPISDAVEVVMKNGRKAVKGRCPSCGGGMFKILGGKAAPVGAESMVEAVLPAVEVPAAIPSESGGTQGPAAGPVGG